MIRNRRYITNGILMLIVFSSFLFYALSTGVTGRTLKNGSGCTCHASTPSTDVSVVIAGPDELDPGETGNYTVTITGGPLAAAGTNIAASEGTLNPGEGLRKASEELTHISPMAASQGMVVFNFTYTAPLTAGQVTLYAAGNSVNNNGSNTGDAWNFAANKVITVSQTTGTDDENMILSFRLEQNYPNPFNPSTMITYSIPQEVSGSLVSLRIYDLLGREIAALVNGAQSLGNYRVSFDASGIPSGVYIYSLKAGNHTISKKMTLTK